MATRKGELREYHPIDPTRADWNLGNAPALARSFGNGQVRAISGADLTLPFGSRTVNHLAQAKRNSDQHFDFVALTEHFDLSLMLLQKLCGWGRHFYVPDHVAAEKPLAISPQMLAKIAALNGLDAELYRYP